MTKTLVLTRPLAQSRQMAALFRRVARIIVSPVLLISGTGAVVELGRFNGVILTSRNAVEHAPSLTGLRAFCVGERTAEQTRLAGARVMLVAQDADALVSQIKANGPLLHLRGETARGDIANRLKILGIDTEELVIYRQTATPLTAEARRALSSEQAIVLPLYSPRSAQIVGEQIGGVGKNVHAIAMSAAVADAWKRATGQNAETAPAPTGDAMLERISSALGGTPA